MAAAHGTSSRNYSLILLQLTLLLLLGTSKTDSSSPFRKWISSDDSLEISLKEVQLQPPIEPPAMAPQPLLPLLAPSPLMMPFTNYTSVPILSGTCPLNFSSAESILSTTAIDCWDSLAPYLANVVCCPQLDAALTILIGQSSFSTGNLAINSTFAKDCLSDIIQILDAQGSNSLLDNICSISPSNLTKASCPMVDVTEIENTVNIPTVLEACEKIDPVGECHKKTCQRAITEAAMKIASKNYSMPDMIGAPLSPMRLAMIDDCKKIVLRWLASKLDPSAANRVLRGISSCKTNKACPLLFPNQKNVSKECGYMIRNQTACCEAMDSYVTQLEGESFITDLQALNCATLLGQKLQKENVSSNVYSLCSIKLKDFSLQAGSPDSGCLLPSLPFDVTYDQSSGIGFKCDLNDNVAAPWPAKSYAYAPAPSYTTPEIPALPTAASDQSGLRNSLFMSCLFILSYLI